MTTTVTNDNLICFNNLPERVVGGFHPAAGLGAGWVPFSVKLDDFEGVGLATGALSRAGELVLDLGLKGWHRLRIAHNPALNIWLDGEVGYWQMPGDPSVVRDMVFPAADFTGRRLHIAPVRGAALSLDAKIFSIRAEPCDGPGTNHRNLIVTNDGHGVLCRGLEMARDIYRHVYPFREGDFFRMVWGLYGGCTLSMCPDTRAGESPLRSDDGSFSAHDWTFNQSLRNLQAEGSDPLTVVRAATREYGLELHYYMRMSAFYAPFPKGAWTTRFFKAHPEWRCRDEHGTDVNFMSYAYPGVQEHVLAFMDELLDYQPEGLCMAFNRGIPLMLFEEPVIEAYKRKYGRVPKLPEECDTPELQAVRHELLADFVTQVRRLCDRRGKALSCIVPRDFARNRLYGLDADLLLSRGLVETVMVGAGHGDKAELNDDLAPLQSLHAIARRAGAKVYGGGSSAVHGMAWVNGNLQARAKRMAGYLDAGLDGGWFWDAEHVIGHEWEAMRRFGDRAALDRIIRGEWPAKSAHETLALGDLVVGRYNPWHSY